MPEPITRKVLVINFRPAAIPATWSQADDLIPQYIEKMKTASGNQLVYQIVKKMDAPNYPVLLGERQYDDVSWARARTDDTQAYRDRNNSYQMVDYPRLLQEYNCLQAIRSQAVDEVWMFGGPYFGFYESCMIGRGAFDCNGPAIERDCARFVIMGFNYERTVREMVHDYGHRAERILAKHFRSEAFLNKLYRPEPTPPPAPRNAFEQFLLAQGTVHRKPGGEEYKQDEFAWLSAMPPEWWPLTIDPNQVSNPSPWYKFLLDLFYRFAPQR